MLPAAALERGAHACERSRLGLTLNGVGTVELYVGEGGDAEGKKRLKSVVISPANDANATPASAPIAAP